MSFYDLVYVILAVRIVHDSCINLEHALFFLKCMIKEHVFMNVISLSKKFNPHNFEI